VTAIGELKMAWWPMVTLELHCRMLRSSGYCEYPTGTSIVEDSGWVCLPAKIKTVSSGVHRNPPLNAGPPGSADWFEFSW
jgi:hypothetical protein